MKIILAYKAYPFTMANYYRRALERREDVELFTVGEFFGQWIPWNGGMEIPMKYYNNLDVPLARGMDRPSWKSIKPMLPWTPDLVLNVDAGFHFSDKPDAPYAVVGTDPHVLDGWYDEVRPRADWFFNMQPTYIKGQDILLPYAFDPTVHFPTAEEIPDFDSVNEEYLGMKKEYDCAIVGLHYPQRDEWIRLLRNQGVKVNYRIGDIYDEYREENNKAWIGLNWSSLHDVTARVFEIMAMGLVPVINRLQGLTDLGFVEGKHYIGFSTMDEAVAQVHWAIGNRTEAEKIAAQAREFVHSQRMTWDRRVEQILETAKLL